MRCVEGAFAGFAATVHLRAGQGEIEQVGGEAPPGFGIGGAQAAVMGFGDGNDVFDIGLEGGPE